MKNALRWLAGLAFAAILLQAQADTLDEVRERGVLRCGVNGEVPGLSFRDERGDWSGLDVDFCRGVGAAVLGGVDKVEFIPTSNADRLERLRRGELDLLSRNTTWTLARDATQDIAFVATLYYDGQGFMVRRETGILSSLELDGKPVCTTGDSTSPENAARYFTRHRMRLSLEEYPDLRRAAQAYLRGDCQVLTTDQSQLFAIRSTLEGGHAEHRILPEVRSPRSR